MHMPNITDYLKYWFYDHKRFYNRVKDFTVINFGECFKSTKEHFYSKPGEEVCTESFYTFLATLDEVGK